MKIVATLLSLLMLSFTAYAQSQNVISVNVNETVDVPADQIQFIVNMNAEGDSPEEAYELHRQREQALVTMLEEFDISEEDLRFEPMSISKRTTGTYERGGEEKQVFVTRQQVAVTFEDFDIYEEMQIRLIGEQFDDFRASFMSSESEQAKDEALQKAIGKAREKAEIIAQASAVTLGRVHNISYGYNAVEPVMRFEAIMDRAQAPSGLLEYDQMVSVQASISMEFRIEEES
jgi:uncharacterized protein YggE